MFDMEESEEKASKFNLIPFTKLIPNALTLASICFGLTSIKFALDGNWPISVLLIVLAALIDGIDGRIARLLKVSTNFGAYLDSLADFVNFGVAPGLIMYLWQLHTVPFPRLGWSISLFFIVCTAVRLARFNANLDVDDKPEWQYRFFVGVPSPAGGLLCLFPLVYFVQFDFVPNLFLCALAPLLSGSLMVSKLPTYSFKRLNIKRKYLSLALMMFATFIILCFIEPWLVLITVGVTYLTLLPMGYINFNKKYKKTRHNKLN